MHIRPATPSDCLVIAEFNLRLAAETEDLALDQQTVTAGVSALLRDPSKGLYFVAEDQAKVIGQVMITYEWSDWRNGNIWWLQSVYVLPEHRKKGVFRALYGHLEGLAAQDPEVCGLRLYMHAANARARETYARLGMRQTEYVVFESSGS